MARSARRNTVMGNSQRNLDKDFPETKEKASRPAYAETAASVRMMKAKKRKGKY